MKEGDPQVARARTFAMSEFNALNQEQIYGLIIVMASHLADPTTDVSVCMSGNGSGGWFVFLFSVIFIFCRPFIYLHIFKSSRQFCILALYT